MIQTTSLALSKQIYKTFPEWDNNASTSYADRLSVWMQDYYTSEMSRGHDDYKTTPANKRNKVIVGDWKVTDDPRHRVRVPEVVFNWWWSEVHKIEQNVVPAYDLVFLLDKLPANSEILKLPATYSAIYQSKHSPWHKTRLWDDNPCNAAGLLVLKLKEANLL